MSVTKAPNPTEEQGIANNNQAYIRFYKATNTASITVNVDDLIAFPSSDPNQGTHKWLALEVNTGITPITEVTYNGSLLTSQDIADAVATGCSDKSFVLYIKADEVVNTPKTFTLGTSGREDITITIKIRS